MQKNSTSALDLGSDWKVIHRKEVDSTMNLAKATSCNQPLLVLADHQTKGRGTNQRDWLAAGEGFYATYRFNLAANIDLSGFSLCAGLVVHQFLAQLGIATKLKWPNDIIVIDSQQKSLKLAGILLESVTGAESFVLIGVGINLRAAPSSIATAAALDQYVESVPDSQQVARQLSAKMLEMFEIFSKQGFKFFRQSWLDNAAYLNTSVVIERAGKKNQGIFYTVDDNGAILLKEDCGQILKLYCLDSFNQVTMLA